MVAVHARPRFSSSGVIWRPGMVVTAEHTIRREEEITVTLPDGSNVPRNPGRQRPGNGSRGPESRAAEPRLRQRQGRACAREPGASLGRSKDSGVNATMGIISAVSGSWRTWRGGRLDRYIRLDLTLYPGSSGGLVVNSAGEALGIATSVLSRIAGLAIPASTVNRVVDEILSRGRVARGYLGVGLQPVELPDHHKGLIVLSLEPDGPAAKAGVLIGDILTSLGGAPVTDTDDIQAVLESPRGGAIDCGRWYRAAGRRETISITIGERPRRD